MIPAHTTFLVVDTETTGFNPATDKVVEIGAVWVDLPGNVLDTYESLVNPGRDIPAAASAVHHIIASDLEGAPSLEDCYGAIAARHPYDVLVGHNLVDFDSQFVPRLVGGRPMLDTLRLAQRVFPDLDSHKNFFLGYHLGLITGPRSERMAHSAKADCIVTARILRKILECVEARAKDPESISVSGLAEWQMKPRVLRTIRFGKHAGSAWSDVPRDYLQWITQKSGMTDPDILHTCKVLLGR